ncbi:MAG: iron-sulfur cluster insertion protein ErpA [Candidatus Poribacteria bacterium]|nr:iron-sulfur cluster insertion protein ErpA [Candidatus Poribacteria bacterium]
MIMVTDAASSKVKELLESEGYEGYGLRVQVVGGGCSGMQYRLGFDEARDGDKVIDKEGLKVFVDLKSALYLVGTTVDYVESLMGAGFKIDNPNVSSTCGCGSSFQV